MAALFIYSYKMKFFVLVSGLVSANFIQDFIEAKHAMERVT